MDFSILFDEKIERYSGEAYRKALHDEFISRYGMNESAFSDLDDDDDDGIDDDVKQEKAKQEKNEVSTEIVSAIKSHQKIKMTNDKAIIYVDVLYDQAVKKFKNRTSKFKVFTELLDFSDVTIFDAMFAYLTIPNADLSGINTSKATSMNGCFYKADFNNDSIKNWDVSACKSFKNMFKYSSFKQEQIIKEWVYNKAIYANKTLMPKIDMQDVYKQDIEQSLKDMDINFDDSLQLKPFSQFLKESQNKSSRMESNREYYRNRSRHHEPINEGVVDTLKNIGKKILEFFKKTAMFITNNVFAIFDSEGNSYGAVSPVTIAKNFGKGGAVQADTNDPIAGSSGIKVNKSGVFETYASDNEKTNLAAMLALTEARGVGGYSAASGGFREKYQEGGTDVLIDEVDWQLRNPGKESAKPILVWGAPGIGKSSIPRSVVEEYNKTAKGDTKKMKALMIVDCSQLASDSLSIPLPDTRTVEEYMNTAGIDTKDIDRKYLDIKIRKCADALKNGALPVYEPTGDPKVDKILDDIANGSTMPIYNEDGTLNHFEHTGDGGLIMLDELFRADPDIFNKLLTLLSERRFGSSVLGSKWSLMACTNRPLDDAAVEEKWSNAPGALMNRFRCQIQFIPSFAEWTTWARKHGFDETTLNFLSAETNADGEYTNWFNFDKEARTAFLDKRAEAAFPSPRSWSNAIIHLNDYCKQKGYSSYVEIPEATLLRKLAGAVGSEMAQDFIDYYKANAGVSNSKQIFNAVNVFSGELNEKIDGLKLPSTPQILEILQNNIKSRYTKEKQMPAKEFENMCRFLVSNLPENEPGGSVVSGVFSILNYFGYDVNSKESISKCPYVPAMKNVLFKRFEDIE